MSEERNQEPNETAETLPDRPEMTATSGDSDRKEVSVVVNKSTYTETDVVGDEALYASLNKMPFYHGFLPREDLALILSNEGDYLIRVSEVQVQKKGAADSGIKRDIVLSLCTSDRDGSEHKQDVKSETGGRKMRNLVIRRYDGKFGIRAGCMFDTIDALLTNYHVSNTNETKEHRMLKTPCDLQSWEYRHSAVKLGDKLGEGAYGEVRKGVLQRKGRQYNVAVKMMKGSGDMSKLKIREMMKEARLMRYFKHPNVVRFYGVAVVEQPLYILLELVNGGALNSYLQKNKDSIKTLELMNMCLGGARGLQYLHANQCIHRDIAARNCLYSADKVVKLSDFGLSLIGKQYKLQTAQKLPIKWLAPETISTLFFTFKTDVYSYGVMCYEIFAEGNEPWEGLSNTEAKRNVVYGKHLQLPDSSPEKFRSFIHEKVFVVDPKRRVVMDDIVRFIEPIINDIKSAEIAPAPVEKSEVATARKPAEMAQSVLVPTLPTQPPQPLPPPPPQHLSTPRRHSVKSKIRDKKKDKSQRGKAEKGGLLSLKTNHGRKSGNHGSGRREPK